MIKAVLVFVVALLWQGSASADQVFIKPGELIASPGQYSGYLDWSAKTAFSADGIPNDTVNNYMHCSTKAYYYMMTDAEQGALDTAARTSGLSREQGEAFQRNLMARVGGEKMLSNILTLCRGEYNRFMSYVTGKDLCGKDAPTLLDEISC